MYQGTLLEFLNMGGSEIILILVVVLLLFGGKKLPELARGLGKGIREFKDASEGVKREIHKNINAMDIDKEEETAKQNTTAAETEKSEGISLEKTDSPKPQSTPIDEKIVNDSQKV